MNRALKSALIQLRGDGVELDPVADLEHILILDKLSRKMMDPPAGNDSALIRPVLRVGNLSLRHLSLGAQRFLSDVVAEWFPDDSRVQDMAYIFCMCHEPEELWQLQRDRNGFLAAIRAWEKTISASTRELVEMVKKFLAEAADATELDSKLMLTSGDYRRALGVLGQLRPIPEAYRMECEAALIGMDVENHGSYGPLIELLCKEYGHDGDHWLWRVSSREINLLMTQRNELKEAEARALKGAQDDRMLRAHHAFTEYMELVRRIKKAKS